MELHEKIRAFRLSKGIKQTYIAQETGISNKKINAIELGRQRMTANG